MQANYTFNTISSIFTIVLFLFKQSSIFVYKTTASGKTFIRKKLRFE